MIILGINAFHGDSSACLVVNGKLIAAVEEERFRRVKHWAGFPAKAIIYCLDEAGIDVTDIDYIAINRNPMANLARKILYSLKRRPSYLMVVDRLRNARRVAGIKEVLSDELGIPLDSIRAKIINVEHHRAHLASSFYVSPYDSAAVLSVDGFGDFVSTMWGYGDKTGIRKYGQVGFPHSLGIYYLAMTQYLGFPHYGDEYKVMGLAPYGVPRYIDKMQELVKLKSNGGFELSLQYFCHHSNHVRMEWNNSQPSIGRVYSDALLELLGPARSQHDDITAYHKDLAASMQLMYEKSLFHILEKLHEKTGERRLCLSGGCAMNSVANGKIQQNTGFEHVYIQSAAGDAGGAIGAAYSVWVDTLKKKRNFVMEHAYYGPGFTNAQISDLLDKHSDELKDAGCKYDRIYDEHALLDMTASCIADGMVIGWFQGRLEWGPRALGNRSILGDPRRRDMKDILNRKIKRRESFRPFAPSILRDAVPEWFERDEDVPFMLKVLQIRDDKRNKIPAVTHVNGSGRLQTVTESHNPRYYRLIKAFYDKTGIPILLNTSFNENEPVVCKPEEALACFLRTKMDILVLNDWFISRNDA